MVTIFSVALDRGDGPHAAACGHAVDVHGAGAAGRDAAAVFGAGQAELLAQDPQQRRVVLRFELTHGTVDVQLLDAP
jgi:hypothetical protein